jgi:hypothetical protein
VILTQFSACHSTPNLKPLNLTTVTEILPVSSIQFFIRSDVDESGKEEEFMRSFYTKNISAIKNMLMDKGININDELFLEDFNSNPNIELEVIKLFPTFDIYRYYWESSSQFETRIEFLLNFIIREDGTIPLEVTIERDDPEYEPGYATKITLNLKFE